jgi:prepilin-type N-terminal cleavage/methylation domain-containing protein
VIGFAEMTKEVLPENCKCVCVKRLIDAFGAWHKRRDNAFTLIELIVVVGLILILTGLVLSTAGYARKKSARTRAEIEIAALSAACESYKSDNAVYPRDTTNGTTDNLAALTASPTPDPRPTSYDPNDSRYAAASFYLYAQLSGNPSGDRSTYTQRSYFQFKPSMLSPSGGTGTVTAIRDPFGNSYGYSTAQQANSSWGFNPTFDLWSTAGTSNATDAAYEQAWLKNW